METKRQIEVEGKNIFCIGYSMLILEVHSYQCAN